MRSSVAVWTLSLAAVVAVGIADYGVDRVIGYDLSFTLFYLIPVGLATWFAGRWAGLSIAVMSCVIWYVADIEIGEKDGQLWPVIWDGFIRLGVFGAYGWLLSMLAQRLNEARQLGELDPLTGVLNARVFRERLEYNIQLARRSGPGLILAYIDVDDFKRVNDVHGHAEGDHILRELGRALAADTRRSDSVARLGGDEFAVMFPDGDLGGAGHVLEKIRRRLTRSLQQRGTPVTFSIGAVAFPQPPESVEEAIHATDGLMYEAKHRGKDTLVLGRFDAATRGVILEPPAPPGRWRRGRGTGRDDVLTTGHRAK